MRPKWYTTNLNLRSIWYTLKRKTRIQDIFFLKNIMQKGSRLGNVQICGVPVKAHGLYPLLSPGNTKNLFPILLTGK